MSNFNTSEIPAIDAESLHAIEPIAELYPDMDNLLAFADTKMQFFGLPLRERELSKQYLYGSSIAEIAGYENIEHETIEEHLTLAANKIGATNRLHMVGRLCSFYAANFFYTPGQLEDNPEQIQQPPHGQLSLPLRAKVSNLQNEILDRLGLEERHKALIHALGNGITPSKLALGPPILNWLQEQEQLREIYEATGTQNPQQLIVLSYGIDAYQREGCASPFDSFMHFARRDLWDLSLSAREIEIATLAMQGLSSLQIARRFGFEISAKQQRSLTVRSILDGVYKKTGIGGAERLAGRLLERYTAELLGHTTSGPLNADPAVSIPQDIREQIQQRRLEVIRTSELQERHINTILLLGQGLNATEIGNLLTRSQDTVKDYLKEAGKITGARGKLQLLFWAYGIT